MLSRYRKFSSLLLSAAFGLSAIGAISLQPGYAAEYRQADVDAEVAHLKDSDPDVRKRAAYHLSEMGKEARSAVPSLIDALNDPITFGEAANALSRVGSDARPAIPSLITCIQDRKLGYDRCYAATALGNIGCDPETVVPVLTKMVASDDETTLRRLSAMALGDFGPAAKESVGALIDAVKNGDKEMRAAAADSIGKIGGAERDIPALVALLDDEVDAARLGATRALGIIGSESVSAVLKLAELLRDNSDTIRQASACSLGKIGIEAKPAMPALKAAMRRDKDGTFHDTVADAIKKIERRSKNQ